MSPYLHWHILHETKMDTMGKLDTAYSYNTLCNTNGIALHSARTESFASGGNCLCFKSNRNADSGGTDRPSFSAQSVGTWCGSHSAAGHTLVFGKSECTRAGMASHQRKSRSRRSDLEPGCRQFCQYDRRNADTRSFRTLLLAKSRR